MMNFFPKAPKHTNVSTFDICFRIFFWNITCLEILLPPSLAPKTHITQCFPTNRPRWEEVLDLSQHHETFEVHVIMKLHQNE
jgi:hypothetical protein